MLHLKMRSDVSVIFNVKMFTLPLLCYINIKIDYRKLVHPIVCIWQLL